MAHTSRITPDNRRVEGFGCGSTKVRVNEGTAFIVLQPCMIIALRLHFPKDVDNETVNILYKCVQKTDAVMRTYLTDEYRSYDVGSKQKDIEHSSLDTNPLIIINHGRQPDVIRLQPTFVVGGEEDELDCPTTTYNSGPHTELYRVKDLHMAVERRYSLDQINSLLSCVMRTN